MPTCMIKQKYTKAVSWKLNGHDGKSVYLQLDEQLNIIGKEEQN